MTITKRSRYQATLSGVLCGDSAGAPKEMAKSVDILADFKLRGGLTLYDYIEPFKNKRFVRAGHPTDDSELTAALATSLVAVRGFNAHSVYYYLREFIHGNDESGRKSFLTDGKAYGSGGTLRSALREPTYQDSMRAFREGRVRIAPTNGALMRSSGAALVSRKIGDIIEIARQQSCITHIHPASQVACIVYSVVLAHLIDGMSRADAWAATRATTELLLRHDLETRDKVLVDAYREVLKLDVYSQPTDEDIWPHVGDVTLSLRIALWGTLHATDFINGLTMVIGVGGDVDTYGAIAGGLLGAHYGVEGIPAHWLNTIIGRDKMMELADQLYDIAYS